MKQEILCPECQTSSRALFKSDTPYPGEHVKYVPGLAKAQYVCDHCGKIILKNDPCCAFSIWADHGRQPYYRWESGYIFIEEEPNEGQGINIAAKTVR